MRNCPQSQQGNADDSFLKSKHFGTSLIEQVVLLFVEFYEIYLLKEYFWKIDF